ncbi:DUF3833 domain-containing protein [Vibrio sp.]|uniref:DUF3833 domain-containing protein n=1 Tax=Vibrio viridaestus TaxID=2487322 RepID=A0A3N9TYH2_9VIBR|nr:DUF3833 domain-containing protein [Vibrio viridaestus]MDC0609504.1 DUF3833 domain-containing protein [Vibrio sp.]RQW61982.1 DUF3833 domain-containing protein [Vibrio viridaestus]
MKYLKLLILPISLFLMSCSADLDEYKESTPDFELFSFFDGQTQAWGMVQDYTGKQTRRFHVDIKGRVNGNQLTLDESFVYHDGETDKRVWTIMKQSDGTYTGTAGDIIGTAKGQTLGNAFRWQYDFNLKLDDGDIDVSFDDWLYRQDENHLFNVSYIKKFGVTVGKVTLFFQKK